MSSLWWLCAVQWRRGKGEQRGRGEERGQGGRASRWGEVQAWQRVKGGERVLRKGWRRVDKGVRKEGRGGPRTERGSGWGNTGWVDAGEEEDATGLSPRHCQPDNGLISLLFTPVWLTGRNGRKRRGRERVRPCTSPVNVTEWDRHPNRPHGFRIHHLENGGQFYTHSKTHILLWHTLVVLACDNKSQPLLMYRTDQISREGISSLKHHLWISIISLSNNIEHGWVLKMSCFERRVRKSTLLKKFRPQENSRVLSFWPFKQFYMSQFVQENLQTLTHLPDWAHGFWVFDKKCVIFHKEAY